MARPGDFNIEIKRNDLHEGLNQVYIQAGFDSGDSVSKLVKVDYQKGIAAKLPYVINWQDVDHIQDVAEVVDGLWQLTPQGIRTAEPYYDRIVAIGDTSWKDYEVTTSVIFHKIFADHPVAGRPPYSSRSHASLLLRWRGHADDGKQPRVKWTPCGGLVMLRSEVGVTGSHLLWKGSEQGLLAEEKERRAIVPGAVYHFKAQVKTLESKNTRYSAKVWKDGEHEPAGWDLVAIDGPDDLQSGSLLLVAHHADVTFGNIEVHTLSP